MAAMKETKFEGMAGRVLLDKNGDMRGAVVAINYILEEVHMKSFELGVLDPESSLYVLSAHPIWPGNTTETPADEEPVLMLGALLPLSGDALGRWVYGETIAGALPYAIDLYVL